MPPLRRPLRPDDVNAVPGGHAVSSRARRTVRRLERVPSSPSTSSGSGMRTPPPAGPTVKQLQDIFGHLQVAEEPPQSTQSSSSRPTAVTAADASRSQVMRGVLEQFRRDIPEWLRSPSWCTEVMPVHSYVPEPCAICWDEEPRLTFWRCRGCRGVTCLSCLTDFSGWGDHAMCPSRRVAREYPPGTRAGF